MTEFDPRRFGKFADKRYAHDKVFRTTSTPSPRACPAKKNRRAGPSKTSPLYERLKSQGCVYTETFGWERPKWFSLDGRTEVSGYRRNNVFEVVRDEVAAVHERVGLLDLSGFAKYDISGRDAESFLNRVCANRMPRKSGGIALVHLLSPQGRILGEMTVTRLADDRFYALSAAAAELRDRDWLTQSLRPRRARADRQRHGGSRRARAFGPEVARAAARPHRCGSRQRGFSLAAGARDPNPRGRRAGAARELRGRARLGAASADGALPALYEALWERGRAFGIANYGLYAVNSMRIEKGYKAWSSELTNELNMLEADMPRFFAAKKDDFVGKAATLAAPSGPSRSSMRKSTPKTPMRAAASPSSPAAAASA